jgi:YaiO family outer membrane protein
MLLSLLLVTLLAEGPQISPAPPNTFGEATQLAMEGRDAEALAAFQKLAGADPKDHEVRVWIGRMQERLGRPAVAEAVYRSVLLEDPSNVDAMIGIGNTLLTRHLTDDAIEMLGRAESLAPSNETVLSSLGRAYREAGDDVRAIRYYERVLAASPTDQHRLSLEDARRSYLNRIEASGFSEDFNNGGSTTNNASLLANIRVSPTVRVMGRGEARRMSGINDQRGGGGVEWHVRPLTALSAHYLVGPDNTVIPEGDFLGEIDHTFGRASYTGTYRYYDFQGAWMAVFAPSISFWPSDRVSIGALYAHTISKINSVLLNQHGNTVQGKIAYRWLSRLWLTGGYAEGFENFETVSIDQVGDFRAHTVSGGFRFDLPSLTSFVGNVDYQTRENAVKRTRFTVGLAQRF